MELGRISGTIVATQKNERLSGFKLLVVDLMKMDGVKTGTNLVALDTVGAGLVEGVARPYVGLDSIVGELPEGDVADLHRHPCRDVFPGDGDGAGYAVDRPRERPEHLSSFIFISRLAESSFPGPPDERHGRVAADDHIVSFSAALGEDPLSLEPRALLAYGVGRPINCRLIDTVRRARLVREAQLVEQFASPRRAGCEYEVHGWESGPERQALSAEHGCGRFGPVSITPRKARLRLAGEDGPCLLPRLGRLEPLVARLDFFQALVPHQTVARGERFGGMGLGEKFVGFGDLVVGCVQVNSENSEIIGVELPIRAFEGQGQRVGKIDPVAVEAHNGGDAPLAGRDCAEEKRPDGGFFRIEQQTYQLGAIATKHHLFDLIVGPLQKKGVQLVRPVFFKGLEKARRSGFFRCFSRFFSGHAESIQGLWMKSWVHYHHGSYRVQLMCSFRAGP